MTDGRRSPAPGSSRTKIVATVGPACPTAADLVGLVRAGVHAFRINGAHGTTADHARWLEAIREAERLSGAPLAAMLDLAGPKIRLGELPDDGLTCKLGSRVSFVRGGSAAGPGTLTTTYARLVDELRPGNRVVLADGIVHLEVERVDDGGATCVVTQGGTVRSRQGVNLPGAALSVPSLSERDREDAAWAARAGVDWVALSFVRRASDVVELSALLRAAGSEAGVVAKIEKPEAVADLDAIVAAADAVMVARGDLGVEMDIAEVPVVQKRIVAACRRAGKPVIVATQMLDSMQHAVLPTRAEASDVANAILDGVDACLLTGETARGEHPREAVEMMHRIALATERAGGAPPPFEADPGGPAAAHPITEATTWAAARIAERLAARLIVVASATGLSALRISRHRPGTPTVGVSDRPGTLRRMCLYWGIQPVAGAPARDSLDLLDWTIRTGAGAGALAPGDRVVLILGTNMTTSRHNALVVHEVPAA